MSVPLPIPVDTKAKTIQVDITPTTLRAGVRAGGKEGELGVCWVDKELAGRVRPDSSFWTVEEAGEEDGEDLDDIKVLSIELEKATKKEEDWLDGLFVGETNAYEAEVTTTVFLDVSVNGVLPPSRVEVGLFGKVAPRTSLNFKALCSHGGDSPFVASTGQPLTYQGSKFHRIIPGFMVQGGDMTKGDGTGGESIYGPTFEDENFVLQHSGAGILSMANSGPDTCGSQFFITLGAAPWLDGRHCVFGRVLGGEDGAGMKALRLAEQCGSDSGDVTGSVEIVSCGEVTY
mmetsp:Transcript_52744/g.105712  ORF Transcript_52744/g.105712 Transcript_52744/m.105712 type:complete len:288 (-) Transcript_52744:341-1204(-)